MSIRINILKLVGIALVLLAQIHAPGLAATTRYITPGGENGSINYLPVVTGAPGMTVAKGVVIIPPQPEWTAHWHQWIESLDSSPVFQQGDIDCSFAQSGYLWFLTGTEGTSPVKRACTIPPYKIVLVPLQVVAWGNEGNENLTVPEKRTVLDEFLSDEIGGLFNTQVCRLEISINGDVVESTRVQSPPFSYLGDPEGVSDGFWFAFRAPVGTHEVKYRGVLCNFDFGHTENDIEVTLTLKVDPAGVPVREPWQLFVWDTFRQPFATGCTPLDPNGVIPCDAVDLVRNTIDAGAPPWSYTAPATGATLTVVDAVSPADEFEVFDNGTSIGNTASVQDPADCFVSRGDEPSKCVGVEGVSFGVFPLEPGPHSITIEPRKGLEVGVGFFRFAPNDE